MYFLAGVFNNRELAAIFWGFVLIAICFFNKKTRPSMITLFKAFFSKIVLIIFLIMILYISLQVFLFYEVRLWDFALVKDTVYWIFGVASVLLLNVNEASKDRNYFKNLFLRNIKIMVIIEFVVNLYAFGFIVEVIVIPIILSVVLVAAFSENKKEYLPANKLVNFLIAIYAIVVLIYSIINLFSDFQNVWTLDNLKAFLLPILLLITFIPFLYLLAIYMEYELLFRRLNIFSGKDEAINRYAKKKILALCNINLVRLNKFVKENAPKLTKFNSKEEIQEIVDDFKAGN